MQVFDGPALMPDGTREQHFVQIQFLFKHMFGEALQIFKEKLSAEFKPDNFEVLYELVTPKLLEIRGVGRMAAYDMAFRLSFHIRFHQKSMCIYMLEPGKEGRISIRMS